MKILSAIVVALITFTFPLELRANDEARAAYNKLYESLEEAFELGDKETAKTLFESFSRKWENNSKLLYRANCQYLSMPLPTPRNHMREHQVSALREYIENSTVKSIEGVRKICVEGENNGDETSFSDNHLKVFKLLCYKDFVSCYAAYGTVYKTLSSSSKYIFQLRMIETVISDAELHGLDKQGVKLVFEDLRERLRISELSVRTKLTSFVEYFKTFHDMRGLPGFDAQVYENSRIYLRDHLLRQSSDLMNEILVEFPGLKSVILEASTPK